MAFTHLLYDKCTYKHALQESMAPCDYMLDQNFAHNSKACFVKSPAVRQTYYGVATCKDLIDVDSELMGLNRRTSRCPDKRYHPSQHDFCYAKKAKECNDLDPENCRISNPPCTLRARGINRFECPFTDMQKHTEIPFPTNVNNRLMIKDNFKPTIPCIGV
jgi:hypothetical protein